MNKFNSTPDGNHLSEAVERHRSGGVVGENPAIKWMILGFVLVIIGLAMVSYPPPSLKNYKGYWDDERGWVSDKEQYQEDLRVFTYIMEIGAIFRLIGTLSFMSATIWGVWRNSKNEGNG